MSLSRDPGSRAVSRSGPHRRHQSTGCRQARHSSRLPYPAADLDEVAWGAPIPDEALKTRQDIVGRGVVATIYQNEPFLLGRLAPKGAGAGLAATIPVGMRAVALRVNEVVGLAGFVVPGMHVDVLMAGNAPSADQARFGTLVPHHPTKHCGALRRPEAGQDERWEAGNGAGRQSSRNARASRNS